MKLRVYNKHYFFAPRLSMILLAILGVAIFTSLGYWQLQRATQKRLLLTHYHDRSQGAMVSLHEINQQANPRELQFRRITLRGNFEQEQQFLLDNRFYKHQLGYHVLTPFKIAGQQKRILINRGWLARTQQRSQLPKLPTPVKTVTIHGFIDYPGKQMMRLGQQQDNPNSWPRIIQTLDIANISQTMTKPFYPFVVKLHPNAVGGFTRHWSQITTMPPQRHVAYAVQWFALALAVFVIFIVTNCKILENELDEKRCPL